MKEHRAQGQENKLCKKGNISILVIFVLLASGVIGVLTMHFVRQMLYYNGAVNTHYKSYYMARAGLELSLTQVQHRGVGFEYQVKPEDAIITENFTCSPQCNVETEIFSQSAYHNTNPRVSTGCSEGNSFVLAPGDSLVLPLFVDAYGEVNAVASSLWGTTLVAKFPVGLKIKYIGQGMQGSTGNLALVTDSPDYVTLSKAYKIDEFGTAFDDFLGQTYATENQRRLQTGNYLIISNSNTDGELLNFCLEFAQIGGIPWDLALGSSHIKSLGHFQQNTIGLEALYQHNVLPSFLSHTSLDL